MRQMKFYTLFKTQNQKKTPHSGEKQKSTRNTLIATSRRSCGDGRGEAIWINWKQPITLKHTLLTTINIYVKSISARK